MYLCLQFSNCVRKPKRRIEKQLKVSVWEVQAKDLEWYKDERKAKIVRCGLLNNCE